MKYSGSISDRIKLLERDETGKDRSYIIPSTDYHNSEYIGEYLRNVNI